MAVRWRRTVMRSARLNAINERGAPWCIVAAIITIAWLLAARIAGPDDLWDQTQPKTVSYTTDIVANGRWVLPVERGAYPATKPPLYNWLAAPAVALFGYDSALAHKSPSVLAFLMCCIAVLRIARRLTDAPGGAVCLGWLTVVLLGANYAMFKLAYLARPDMLLVMWLTLGWWACTAVLTDPHWMRHPSFMRSSRAGLIWICLALAGLTKGPAAIVLVVYVLLAPKLVTGRWSAIHRTQWWWGAPLSIVFLGWWAISVWMTNADHVIDQLWYAEFYGRLTGTGPEGSQQGPIGVLRTFYLPAFYFLTRFAPWSVLTIMASIAILRRDTSGTAERNAPDAAHPWRRAALVFVCAAIGLYMLSSSKRPDYIAPSVPLAALLASWWLVQCARRWCAPTLIAVVASMIALTTFNITQPSQPSPDFATGINQFVNDARRAMRDRPADVVYCWTGSTHLQAMLGHSKMDGTAAFESRYAMGTPFWVIAGRRKGQPHMFDGWVADRRRFNARVACVALSPKLPRAAGWPGQCGLYWVEPETPVTTLARP